MTAAFLQSELSNLISDSKRKSSDVRSAAEKSLSELKSISVTSETQLAGDLLRRPQFVEPFVLACKSQNAKLAGAGAACLQRLVASTAVSRSRLADVLQAFEEAIPLGLDVQLKILQTLPSLLQLYAADLHGETLARTLSVSADLSSSKVPVVSSTAGATFQQLVSAVFSRITNSRSAGRLEDNASQDAEDALLVFMDLCGLLTGEKSKFVRLDKLPPAAILETLEGLLTQHGKFILNDADCLKACTDYLMPGLHTVIEDSVNYGVVGRAMRIAFILITQHIARLQSSIADLLGIILRSCDRPGNHKWKRILALELIRGLCSDFDALRAVFAEFDLKDGHKNFVSECMASFVRIASEDPVLIGLGRQSTIPIRRPSEAPTSLAEAGDIPIGNVARSDNAPAGISQELSTITTPCLDQFDRLSPPEVPETYVFTLVLSCISSFSDGLSRAIMPLSVPSRKMSKIEDTEAGTADNSAEASAQIEMHSQKHRHLVNPLSRNNSVKRAMVEHSALLIESCWPAALAICSTFLNAALDSYFYHMLIRTIQKLTQVAGVLELDIPRDALLTTLAKVSVPANVTTLLNTLYGGKPALESSPDRRQDAEVNAIKSPVPSAPRQSIDLAPQNLNVRNLLCLRALLNLGIALGPSLSYAAWTIILQSLQQVEALMSAGQTARALQESLNAKDSREGSPPFSLAAEISAVDTARRRMLDSTGSYPTDAFKIICNSMFRMIEDILPDFALAISPAPGSNGNLRPKLPAHKSTRSVSGSWAKTATLEIEIQFVLKTVGRLASVNLHRFKDINAASVSWELIIANLLLLQRNHSLQPQLRLQAAKIIDAIVVESCTSSDGEEDESEKENESRILLDYGVPALAKQVENIQNRCKYSHKATDAELKIICNMLETVQNLVGARGEALATGWEGIFTILNMVARGPITTADNAAQSILLPAAFKVVQLIVSDFLAALDESSLQALLTLFDNFGAQRVDLNIALTTTALFWNLGSLMVGRYDSLPLFHVEVANVARQFAEKANLDTQMAPQVTLWQQLFYGLAGLCQDDRSEVRDAAMRMLMKILEASVAHMSSSTLNSIFTTLLLPLLGIYGSACISNAAWRTSTTRALEDFVGLFQQHGELLLEDPEFSLVWLKFMRVTMTILSSRDGHLMTRTFDTISEIISCIRHIGDPGRMNNHLKALATTWNLWREYQPAEKDVDGPNQTLLASHLRVWLELIAWGDGPVTSFEDMFDITTNVLRKCLFAARHEQYTIDIARRSPEQEQALEIMGKLRSMAATRKMSFAQLLLGLSQDLVDRTALSSGQPDTVLSSQWRQPSGIAFVTACVDQLITIAKELSTDAGIWQEFPIGYALELSAHITKTKYSALPSNASVPLWQRATLLGTSCANIAAKHCSNGTATQIVSIAEAMNTLLKAVTETPQLDEMGSNPLPSPEQLLADEKFDISQLQQLQLASSVYNHQAVSEQTRKQYIILLFLQSLAARPWYHDLTNDLDNDPLKDLTLVRRGSVRAPDLPARRLIYKQTLECLMDCVKQKSAKADESLSPIARLAAPYILLRFAHTLRTFIADQPLRYLEHPHPALQEELHFVLRAFVNLRVIDVAFEQSAVYLEGKEGTGTVAQTNTAIRRDNKSHLRIMFSLMLRFEEVWCQIPRLKSGHAWQDQEHGKGVEHCLKRWKEAVSDEWGPIFS